MDTYWNTNCNCIKCGRCVKACREKGEDFLRGGRDVGPNHYHTDYVPCHHCTDRFDKPAPCKEVCYYDAIEIERW